LRGAFGFIVDNYYNLATAMVFGSTTSASSWEPFQWVIEMLSEAYGNQPDLVIMHKKYLDMIGWADLIPTPPLLLRLHARLIMSLSVLIESKRTFVHAFM
jgi:hypothetical protein